MRPPEGAAEVTELLERRREERIVLGLERLRDTLARLGDPQEKYPSIVVAGTNGKGSCCALLEAALRASGRRTGLTVSPHLFSIHERIRVAGRDIDDLELADCFRRVLAAEQEPLTYFELVTAAAYLHFADKGVEAAVLEVGLGGRLDAVNIVRSPLVSIIASIGFDHMEFLGSSLGAIAREKAGVLRPGGAYVLGRLPPEALDAVESEAERLGALRVAGDGPFRAGRTDWGRGLQVLDGPGAPWPLALLGGHQLENANVVALAAGELARRGLGIPEAALRLAFETARWPGRFELVREADKVWVLDGGHNPQAAEAFARTWAASPWAAAGSMVLGLMRDKDAAAFLKALAPHLRKVFTCAPNSPRALPAAALAEEVRRLAPLADVEACPDIETAIRLSRPGPATAILGSFYLLGGASRILKPGR